MHREGVFLARTHILTHIIRSVGDLTGQNNPSFPFSEKQEERGAKTWQSTHVTIHRVHFQQNMNKVQCSIARMMKKIKSLQLEKRTRRKKYREGWELTARQRVRNYTWKSTQGKNLMSLYIANKCTVRSKEKESIRLLRKIRRKNNS